MYEVSIQKVLLADDEENVMEFYKETDLKECVYMIANAWNDVESITLERAWRKINRILKTVSEIQGSLVWRRGS